MRGPSRKIGSRHTTQAVSENALSGGTSYHDSYLADWSIMTTRKKGAPPGQAWLPGVRDSWRGYAARAAPRWDACPITHQTLSIYDAQATESSIFWRILRNFLPLERQGVTALS